ncbi:MAG: hypothetical protein IJ514_04065 [Clostridia bacterium]|nr:hypothetical protein [Clostridia bacterium]
MMEYKKGEGWILTGEDKIDLFEGESVRERITHAPDYPTVDTSAYTDYYFDSADGYDEFDGLTPLTAKKSIQEAERICREVKAGDRVRLLFKRGCTFVGNFTIKGGEPSDEFPLILDAYGEGEGYPVFYGDDSVVKVNVSNIRLYNLEVTGPTAYRGIHVLPDKKGAMKNIVVESCFVHDINWNWVYPTEPKDTCPDDIDVEVVCPHFHKDGKTLGRYWYRYFGGIIFHNEIGPSWFENIWVLKNVVKNVARTGMTIYNKWVDKPGVGYGYNTWMGYDFTDNDVETGLGYFVSKNIYWNDNYVECAGGDGFVVSSAENVFVERNKTYYSNLLGRTGYWNGGLWVYNVKDAIFQYNEAAYTWMRHGSEDSEGFDIDNACVDLIVQHNYSHHNEGGGILFCNLATPVVEREKDGTPKAVDEKGEPIEEKVTGRWFRNIVRNNVFYENGNPRDVVRSGLITIARETDHVLVYNNTVVLRDDIDGQSVIHTEDESTYCYNNVYANNVFYAPKKTGARFTVKMMKNSQFINNLYYNMDGQAEALGDEAAIVGVDPLITPPKDCLGIDKMQAFALGNKEVLVKGKEIKKASETDGVGNENKSAYLGAICK